MFHQSAGAQLNLCAFCRVRLQSTQWRGNSRNPEDLAHETNWRKAIGQVVSTVSAARIGLKRIYNLHGHDFGTRHALERVSAY
jgi:hypothetical protein